MPQRFSFFLVVLLTMIVLCPVLRGQQTVAETLLPYAYSVKKQRIQVLNAEKQLTEFDIAYIEQGRGSSTILFLHGLASYLPEWDKTIADLSTTYRCIALDFPGYGRSSRCPKVSMKLYAEVVAAFMDSLKLSAVNLAGHSMGAQIGIMLAVQRPKAVSRLMLIAPSGIETFNKKHREFINIFYRPNFLKAKSETIVKSDYERGFTVFPADAAFMVQDRLAIRSATDFDDYCTVLTDCVKAAVNEPIFNDLHKISQPTLIVFGADDNLIPSSIMHPTMTTEGIGRLAKSKIKNSRLLLIPNCGHFVQFENPRETNTALREFLK